MHVLGIIYVENNLYGTLNSQTVLIIAAKVKAVKEGVPDLLGARMH